MAWTCLIAAGLLEIVWAFAMKKSLGFTLLVPSLVTLATMAGSFALLSFAMRSLPLGTAYVIWTGIGALGAFIVGIAWLGDTLSLQRVVAAGFILVGLVLMKLSATA
jgi:quaternary ammonium compound-resistance protein SugE